MEVKCMYVSTTAVKRAVPRRDKLHVSSSRQLQKTAVKESFAQSMAGLSPSKLDCTLFSRVSVPTHWPCRFLHYYFAVCA